MLGWELGQVNETRGVGFLLQTIAITASAFIAQPFHSLFTWSPGAKSFSVAILAFPVHIQQLFFRIF
jgi:hypothetical protein